MTTLQDLLSSSKKDSPSIDALIESRPYKLYLHAHYKVGKTTFALSIIPWLQKLGYTPEQIKILFIDIDDGTLPLLAKGIVPKEFFPSIHYELVHNFGGIVKVTNEMLPILQKHQKEFGLATAWIITDNMKIAWQWAREHVSMEVYGMPEYEMALLKRVEAQAKDKKSLPALNQLHDYGIINAMYNGWAEKIKYSGVNFIWLTPTSEWEDYNTKIKHVQPAGQGDNEARVDHILRLTLNENADSPDAGKRFLHLTGTRRAKMLFSNLRDTKNNRDPDFEMLVAALKKVS